LNIRGKSVGEELEVNIICPDDGETAVPVNINIDDIHVQKNENHTTKIQVDDNIIMEMKYPSRWINLLRTTLISLRTIIRWINRLILLHHVFLSICTADEVWSAADCTKKELIDFLEQMNSSQFKLKIESFFETMPKLSHEIKVKNPNTGVESTVVLEGLSSFFA
jgi:hypothetical protein